MKKNPEYYTIWNHRRRIYASEFTSLDDQVSSGTITREDYASQVLDIIKLDLQFLFPLLLRFPKCYWIWNHRLWLLQSGTDHLPAPTARGLWEEELELVGKMLSRDSRNFLGWGYRRTVIASLESPQLDLATGQDGGTEASAIQSRSMALAELEYTTKMIGTNLSNFSAWHNRTKLILQYLREQQATDDDRRKMLDEGESILRVFPIFPKTDHAELSLIHRALFDPYDASLWSYHHNLLCTFDPKTAPLTMAPNLSPAERLQYLHKEREFVEEMLDPDGDDAGEGADVDDCKWIFQRLIDIVLIGGRVKASQEGGEGAASTNQYLSKDEQTDVKKWLKKLYVLDPLRRGRWQDLEKSLER